MTTFLIILGFVVWVALGVGGFIYTWTKWWDFGPQELPLAIMSSILGPLAFIDIDRKDMEDSERQTLEHVETMRGHQRALQTLGVKPKKLDWTYLSNPHYNKTYIRTRNETIRKIQDGEQ